MSNGNYKWLAALAGLSAVFVVTKNSKKGKVRTLSGKPHTPRKLKEDQNITPEEASKRLGFKAPVFQPDDDKEKDDDDEDDEIDFFQEECRVCGRGYEFSKIARVLVQHYLKESDDGQLGWKSKDNPKGTARTARNIAGAELYTYGTGALEHYIFEGKVSKLYPMVVGLLRTAIVPSILAGDTVQFIESMEIEGIEDTDPRFSKGFAKDWEAEENFFLEDNLRPTKPSDDDFRRRRRPNRRPYRKPNRRPPISQQLIDNNIRMYNAETDYITFREEHEEHDDIDDLIKDLDELTAFCINFLHDGAHGGESMGRKPMGDGMEEERVRYVEGSIEIKFVFEDDENTLIRVSYTNDPDGPVIYLPPTSEIKDKPEDERGRIDP